MKVASRSKYGSPGVLSIRQLETPVPQPNQVLVKVYAATVNRTDCHILSGLPPYMRLFTGLFKPRFAITGTDFAGQVESIGNEVNSFKPGDKVIGFNFLGLQSHADYLVLSNMKDIAPMPANLDYNGAAACVEGAYYALNVINKLKPMSGQTALVNGATGAIGSAILQFFKYYGLSVTAVCRKENNELVQSLGADRLIDYQTTDFTSDPERFDFVFDATGKRSFGSCRRLLKKKGMYASSGAPNLLWTLATPFLGGQKQVFAPPKDLKECLAFIKDLAESGKFKPVIDRVYPLDQIAEAFEYVASGQKIGNVIVTMHSS